MRMVSLTILAGCVAAQLSGATVGFQTTSLGGNSFRDTYFVSGFMFQAGQELDLIFDPALYGTFLGPGSAPTGFNLMLQPPNVPLGFPGDFSALALVNNPPLGPFSVDFTFLGAIPPGPGSQPFQIFDQNFNLIQSGLTTPQGMGGVPEPASFALAGGGILLGVLWSVRRRTRASRRSTAPAAPHAS